MPSEEEKDHALQNLKAVNQRVDYIFTHEGPASAVAKLQTESFQSNPLSEFFEMIRLETEYCLWLFGHYHEDHRLSEREVLLYHQIIRIR